MIRKLFFFGKKSHDYGATNEQINLQGFTSDSLSMIELFRKETRLCRSAIDPLLEKRLPGGPDPIFQRQLFTPHGCEEQV
jgi:hypothetical protein